jgi:hypothetical protein
MSETRVNTDTLLKLAPAPDVEQAQLRERYPEHFAVVRAWAEEELKAAVVGLFERASWLRVWTSRPTAMGSGTLGGIRALSPQKSISIDKRKRWVGAK